MTSKLAFSGYPKPDAQGDIPRDELLRMAEETLERMPGAEVHLKFTCPKCQERCTLEKANYLPEFGECFKCGTVSPITKGGMVLMFTVGGDEESGGTDDQT